MCAVARVRRDAIDGQEVPPEPAIFTTPSNRASLDVRMGCKVSCAAALVVLAACGSSNGDVGSGSAVDYQAACKRASTIQRELLQARDMDVQSGLIDQNEPPCNFSERAKASLTPDRLKMYADGCAEYARNADTCNSVVPRRDAGP